MLLPLLLALLAQAGTDVPPDVVLIVGDDIALSDLDVTPTPHLDFLASQGVSFRRAHAHPLCSPTRRSLFFGRWPGLHTQSACNGVKAGTPHHSEYGLARLFVGAGYTTGLFGKWHLGTNELGPAELSPNLHGFHTWRAGLAANVVNCGGRDYWNWTRIDDGVARNATRYQTSAVRDGFLDWWSSTETTPRPRFAYVAYQAAHKPLHVPPGHSTMFPFSDREKYELMIGSLDDAIGAMLDVVDLSRTYVVFLGDNGTPRPAIRPDQQRHKVKRSTFEDGVVVPLIVAGPGLATGETDALVHVVDVLATLAELIGTAPPPSLQLDSESFVGALLQPREWTPPRPFVFCENDTPGVEHDRAVVTERWKLRDVDGVEELYDLELDPREEDPLDPDAAPYRELSARLRRILEDPSAASARFRR